MKKYDALCVGLALINFPIRPVSPALFKNDVTQVESIDLLPGGDAANQAITLSKLGLRVGLLSRCGEDELGQVLRKTLEGSEIDTFGLKTVPRESTGVCAMMIEANGQRHFCTHRGSLLRFCIDDIDLDMVRSSRVVSIGGLMSLPALDGRGTERLFCEAHAAGAITVADTKKDLWSIGLNGIRATLRETDYFFPSYEEASAITGETEPEQMADVLLKTGVENVGIKLGGDGFLFKNADQCFCLPCIPSNVVDTTGAGDTFMSAFIAGLIKEWDVQTCCRFATAAGSLCVANVGPNTAIQSFEQVEKYMKGAYSNENSGYQ